MLFRKGFVSIIVLITAFSMTVTSFTQEEPLVPFEEVLPDEEFIKSAADNDKEIYGYVESTKKISRKIEKEDPVIKDKSQPLPLAYRVLKESEPAVSLSYSIKYFKDLDFREEVQATEKGKQMAFYRVFYSNLGHIIREEHFYEGKLGTAYNYKQDGKRLTLESWKNGKEDGQWYLFDQNKKKIPWRNYADGKKTGIWYHYDPNFRVMKTSLYYLGSLEQSTFFKYNPDNSLSEKKEYKQYDGKDFGYKLISTYSPKGELLKQESYDKQQPFGIWFYFRKDGKKQRAEFYDKAGKLVHVEQFYYNEMGQATERLYQNTEHIYGNESYTYNDHGKMTREDLADHAGPRASISYED